MLPMRKCAFAGTGAPVLRSLVPDTPLHAPAAPRTCTSAPVASPSGNPAMAPASDAGFIGGNVERTAATGSANAAGPTATVSNSAALAAAAIRINGFLVMPTSLSTLDQPAI